MITTFETAKVGDRVFSLVAGWTEISKLEVGKAYPITVKKVGDQFPCETQFLLNGKLRDSGEQILFWDEIKFDVPKKPVEVPAKDVLVLVKTCCNSTPLPRYSTGVLKSNRELLCYEAGCTSKTHGSSFSNGGKITSWPMWAVAE